VPLLLRIKGYWPGQIGVGHDLPKGVVQDWRTWSLMPEYLFGDASVDSSGFAHYPGQVLSLAFTDDLGFAPPAAVNHLLSKLCSAKIELQMLEPKAAGLKRIGHFGFFRKASNRLWQSVTDWIIKCSV
jgi:predicted alpha/beta hydrolase